MKFGVIVPTQGATYASVAQELQRVEALGYDSAWMPGIPNGPDVLTLLAMAGATTSRIELGPAIVATYPRHPVAMAAQALTVHEMLSGRLTLGIGASHQSIVEKLWGLSYERPAAYMEEYLQALIPLLETQRVNMSGSMIRTKYRLEIAQSSPKAPSVFIAALGPHMLRVGARCATGVATWMVGPTALETLTIPTVNKAAAEANRNAPRILASLPFLLTASSDEALQEARDLANTEFALYAKLPAYQAMFAIENAQTPADIAVFGDEQALESKVKRLKSIGVTDLQITPFGDGEQRARTVEFLASLR
jgi:5,10-methylenetetrahydromethanopterin reductase